MRINDWIAAAGIVLCFVIVGAIENADLEKMQNHVEVNHDQQSR